MTFTKPLPLSLYVHYPWCVEKCPYCDFNSHTAKAGVDERAYLEAMVTQLERMLPDIWGRPIESIFFGGGTPSLISEEGLNWFMSQMRALLGFGPDIEVTLEANPGTVDYQKFAGFFGAGINRLSMGIQSFDDEKLKTLGRIHSSNEADSAIKAAKNAGFENFNLDLMFALPNQTLEQAMADVRQAMSYHPPHLSHYQLTIEPNTPFYKNPPVLPEDDLAWEMQQACQHEIATLGYQHYEVSAYAQQGRHCRHNVNYWQFGDYIGLGAGAHGKITMAPQGTVYRTQMPASPGGFIETIKRGDSGRTTWLEAADLEFEFMLNALRLQNGFSLDLFAQRTGLNVEAVELKMKALDAKGLIYVTDHKVTLTTKGKQYLNDVVGVFLS